MTYARPSRGMRIFNIVWCGQLVSLIGSGLTSFVLGLWVYQRTQSVTQFALILFSATLPRILLSPLAGALADRWDRRLIMLLSDAGAGISILAVALLYFTHQLETWHIYVASAASAVCGTFQFPAYVATTTVLVPKQQLGRINGLLQLGLAAQDVIAPALAGVLIAIIQLGGVLLIDVGTFFVAVITLLWVRFPSAPTTAEGEAGKGSLLREALYGWHYIMARPGLFGLLLFFASTSFLNGLIGALIYPLILAFSPATSLGIVASVAGGGLVLGSVVMSAWNGPKQRIAGVLCSEFVFGLGILLIGLRPSTLLITIGAVIAHTALPVSNVTNQAIWQNKVSPDVQGRVFAMRQMVGRAVTLMALLLAGPLADDVFDPLLAVHGPLAGNLGQLTGVGPGRGIGLMFLLMGMLALLTTVFGYFQPRLRLIDNELPDASEVPLARAPV
jgi:DHA3 family macrolide efflux protein-like MFS transporter